MKGLDFSSVLKGRVSQAFIVITYYDNKTRPRIKTSDRQKRSVSGITDMTMVCSTVMTWG